MPQDFTARIIRAPRRKPKSRFGILIFIVTIVATVSVAAYYRYNRDTRDRFPIEALARDLGGALVDASATDAMTESARRALEEVRAPVADLVPFAIGGCRAQLSTGGGPAQTAIIANVYFRGGGDRYVIECTAIRGESGYAITRVWKADRLRSEAAEHTRESVDAFLMDENTDSGAVQIDAPRLFFYPLQ